MSEININSINEKLNALTKDIEALKAQKAELNDPTIKGLDIKFSELDLSKASAVIHLHNAILSKLEQLEDKVKAIDAKASN